MGEEAPTGLTRTLSPLGVWGLSFGCIIGWGAFVMPATTLLPAAGPAGTLIAFIIGTLIILAIAVNYHFMCKRYPESGGAFAFTKHLFGYDHAFLCSWALSLAYIAILWANATAFILISRYVLGAVFQFGFHYQVAGYDVYFGEILVTLLVLFLFGGLACARKAVTNAINTVLALVLLFGTIGCFLIVAVGHGGSAVSFEPAFAPGEAPVAEVFGIIALMPWAFLGFESVSHAAGECAFSPRKMLPIMAAAIIAGAVVYLSMTAVSIIGMPDGYGTWFDYISDLGNLDGLKALPVFYALDETAGQLGLVLLAAVVVSALSTSLLGLYRASSRLLYYMSQDGILPDWFAVLNKNAVPRNAILFIMLVSVIVPFVGRAAIGWITDVTAVSAAIAYGYTSMCSLRVAKMEGNGLLRATSVIGIVSSVVFLAYPLLPMVWSVGALSAASYMIIIAWGIAGLAFFRFVFKRDASDRFGKSPIVWLFMLFLVFFASTMWVRLVTDGATQEAVDDLNVYYVEEYADQGIALNDSAIGEEEAYVQSETNEVRSTLMNSSLAQTVLIVVSLVLMYNIYSLMLKREREHDALRAVAEEASVAKTTFLSNMSHDIRTPMNAIIGYTHLARREGMTLEDTQAYLAKIDASSKHMLALINDVLEMSRIESGKMDLQLGEVNVVRAMGDVRDLFATQMQEKGIAFTVDASGVRDAGVLCDETRLNRVLLNLLSNAYKFTPSGGSVAVTMVQLPSAREGFGSYELHVKDSGIGMSPEFARNVFSAFERERTSTVSGIEGTGLGMAITKNIVEMMGGSIAVETEQGKGTEFIVSVELELVDSDGEGGSDGDAGEDATLDFTGKRILVAEDNEINREIAAAILEDMGFEVETAENGKLAVEKVDGAQPGHYDAVLMDVRMPVMDGYEATHAIRSLGDSTKADLPIIAASANAFAEDVRAALDAGMDAHIAKPLDVDELASTLAAFVK